MSLDTIKAFFETQLQNLKSAYLKDLEKMSEEDLLGAGGPARKGIDFTYEVSYVNHRFATRLKGETPEPWPDNGWMVAPEEYRTKEAAIRYFTESIDEMIAAWQAIPAGEILKVIPLTTGETSPLDLVYSCCEHGNYHDGQLNYIQELGGDMTVHWQ